MGNDANLPVWTLVAGAWRAEVFDPRPDPLALGPRYCHGGYVRALWYQDRLLTGRPRPDWIPVDGEGLPEEFEVPFGFATALEGEFYMRIGAGRLRRQRRDALDPKRLAAPVQWELLEADERHVRMRCADSLQQDATRHAYELLREVRIHEQGLDSITTLRLDMHWSHPMEWFAHPFFRHSGADRTGFQLPGNPEILGPMTRDAAGLCRLPPRESLAAAVNLWGESGPVVLHLDPAVGGGQIALQLDRPLDHLVLYCSDRVASPETKLMRAWRDGETATWTLTYRVPSQA